MDEPTNSSNEEVFNAPDTGGQETTQPKTVDKEPSQRNSSRDGTGAEAEPASGEGKGTSGKNGDESDIFTAPKADKGDKDGTGDANTETVSEVNPIEYEAFTFPDGMEEADETRLKDFTERAKENNLTQEQAQASLDNMIRWQGEMAQEAQQATENYRREEEKQLIADAEFGGKNITETYERGKRYILNELDPALKDVVIAGGWIHPQLMKHFARLEKGSKNKSGTSEPTGNHKGDPPNMKPANVKDSHLMYPNDAPK